MTSTAQKLRALPTTELGAWRELEAVALDARSQACGDWLDRTDDLIDAATRHGDDKLAAELRSVAALVRDRRNELNSTSRALRTAEL